MEAQIREQAVLQTLGAVEAAVDMNMNAIDNLGEDDFDRLRAKRLQEMKERQKKMVQWRQQGHGTYTELNDEREFFEAAKKSERVIVHFYRPASKFCVYMDKQLRKLCRFHMEVKHVKINAEKVPYLCEKLNIVTLPSVVLVKNRKVRSSAGPPQLIYLSAWCAFLSLIVLLVCEDRLIDPCVLWLPAWRTILLLLLQTEHTCIGFDEFGGHEAPTAYFAAVSQETH